MLKKKLEFIIRVRPVTKLDKILEMVEAIKKAHPNADIRVEVEMIA